MTYEEAEKITINNLGITTVPSSLKHFPMYIKYVVIAPERFENDWAELAKVFQVSVEHGFDNRIALLKMGLINEELDVFLLASHTYELDGSIISFKKLSKYSEELDRQLSE
jgi:hypothetical protein